jgi:hypothetical protein
MSEGPKHYRATYNDVHNLIRASAGKIQAEFKPDMFIAIGARAYSKMCFQTIERRHYDQVAGASEPSCFLSSFLREYERLCTAADSSRLA